MTQASGYSGTPLHRKLGFKPGFVVNLVAPPKTYAALLSDAEGVTFRARTRAAQAAHIFLHSRGDIAALALRHISLLAPKGMLWLSWAKKSSPLHAGVTEDDLRAEVLPLGWVDVKVCALDADWSALKFLKRKAI